MIDWAGGTLLPCSIEEQSKVLSRKFDAGVCGLSSECILAPVDSFPAWLFKAAPVI
jgi:hypothetical protein